MKIAIDNPIFIFEEQNKNYNGYNLIFLRKHVSVIYLRRPWNLKKFRDRFKELNFDVNQFIFTYKITELNNIADVLISFNGRPDLNHLAPPRKYKGLKIYHIMDFVLNAKKSNRNLLAAKVDFLMGYANHGKYSEFFKYYYKTYLDKLIVVPFGYGNRFDNFKHLKDRTMKVIALGSVNPINDPALVQKNIVKDYINFYKNKKWTHEWRRELVENEEYLSEIMDSRLPHFPKTKDFSSDVVSLLNEYIMFANDVGLMGFPPARTYEGIAAGAVLVGSKHDCYTDIGLIDGINCILHNKNDINDFKNKVQYYINNFNKLLEIQANGYKLVKEKYNHEAIADKLYFDIFERWKSIWKS